ncbi:CRISPR-associated protein Cas4 [Chondrinema litorale]|uniref:CRISPR-associated protein Cas4 n=1 Tax=Chondrinema litorale TaxID=2994555 RepID=UPI002542D13E|nr:CRISPR-associated protein Cas4 [Chondrinema litorale]UZR99838.1 CRISPR-associated protein Cas4 [Chondrinema litorale]
MLTVTAQHIHYLHICKRKLWLILKGVSLETTSERVMEGKFLHDTAYSKRAKRWQEIDLGSAKIDHYDPKTKTILEVKISNKMEWAHEAQVYYYLWLLQQMGILDPSARLEYPLLKKTKTLKLNPQIIEEVVKWKKEIEYLESNIHCPHVIKKTICKNCAFHDFCYVTELIN